MKLLLFPMILAMCFLSTTTGTKLTDVQKRPAKTNAERALVLVATAQGKSFYTDLGAGLLTQRQAAQFCFDEGMFPASLLTSTQHIFVSTWVEENNWAFWLDGNKDLIVGDWRWRRTNSPFTFNNWFTGHPENGNGINCSYLDLDISWMSGTCSYTNSQLLPLCETP